MEIFGNKLRSLLTRCMNMATEVIHRTQTSIITGCDRVNLKQVAQNFL